MKQKELAILIETGVIESVTLYKPHQENHWEIWTEGGEMLKHYGNRLMTERGAIKTYTSIDRAFEALSELGWTKQITIDSAKTS